MFGRQRFPGRVEAVDFFPQVCELFRVAEKVKEEGREDRLRSIGSSNDNKVTVVDDDIEGYFFFLCTKLVGL